MVEVLSVLTSVFCVGLLLYFRYTDVRNVTVQTLKNHLKQSEKHIEMMINKKGKEFEDKTIASEIVIERMHRLALSLQDKLDSFDGDIIQGEEIFEALKKEVSVVHTELSEYRQIRSEFKDIEDRIEGILNIKKQAEDGALELRQLQEKMHFFSEEYTQITEHIKNNSRKELDNFFYTMQQDLSEYLANSRQQLTSKDIEMTNQIQELGTVSGSIEEQIKEFKDYTRSGIEHLKQEYEQDLLIAKTASEDNITDIYDMWSRIKEQTQQDTDYLMNTYNNQKEFFETSEYALRNDIEQFSTGLATLSAEIQTNLDLNIQEKYREFDSKIADIYIDIEKKGNEVQDRLGGELTTQTVSIREELERLHSAFVEQEQGIEDRIRVLGSRVSEGLALAENSFQENLVELQQIVDQTKTYSENILQTVQEKIDTKIVGIEDEFRDKAYQNMIRLEESFKEINQERVQQSINDITTSLEQEFKHRYQESTDDILRKAEELEDLVKSRYAHVEELDQRLITINELFNNEKEKIIFMCGELEKDREQSTDLMLHQIKEYMLELQNELNLSVQQFLESGRQNLLNEQESWKERYDEVVKEGRDEYHKIKQDIDTIHRFIADLEDTSLNSLKRSAERLTYDTEHRVEDFKKYLSDLLRNSKEEFLVQTDQAKSEIKDLRQELRNQEKELQQLTEKDLERLRGEGKEIEKQFQKFIEKSKRLDYVEDLLRKLPQQYSEINNLKKELDQVENQLKIVQDQGQGTIRNLDIARKELEQKIESLNSHSSSADRMQEGLITAMKDADQLMHLFATLSDEREKAQQLEELLQNNLMVFNDLQESLDQLEHKRVLVQGMQDAIDTSKNDMVMLSSSSEEINSRMNEMNIYAHDIQDKLQQLQHEMRDLAGDQTKVKTAVSKLNDLEMMVIHIDEEMKRLEKMREWIAKSMNNVEKMGVKMGTNSFISSDSVGLEDANVKNILRLYEKDWSIDDIAKNLKLTSAYVELILERYRP
ncbi:MAG: hypothetical protein ACRCWI_05340 [Brevinema sp.]